jgi:hypothetical protein
MPLFNERRTRYLSSMVISGVMAARAGRTKRAAEAAEAESDQRIFVDERIDW